MCLRGTSLIVVFLENCFLLVAVAAASDFAPYLLLEGLELRGELCEEGIVGVFLDYVVHEAHGKDEFLCMLVFGEAKRLCLFHHGCDVVMAAEVEVQHLSHFSVFGLDHVVEIRFLFFFHNICVF